MSVRALRRALLVLPALAVVGAASPALAAAPHVHTDSTDFSGYTAAALITQASLQLTVPNLDCSDNSFSRVRVGLFDHASYFDVNVGAFLELGCDGGSEFAYVAVQTPNFGSGSDVAAGDKLRLSYASNDATLTVAASVNSAPSVRVSEGADAPVSMLLGAQRFTGCGGLPLPAFGGLPFYRPMINGSVLKASSPAKSNMSDSGTTLATTSSIYAGGGFKVTFRAAEIPAPPC